MLSPRPGSKCCSVVRGILRLTYGLLGCFVFVLCFTSTICISSHTVTYLHYHSTMPLHCYTVILIPDGMLCLYGGDVVMSGRDAIRLNDEIEVTRHFKWNGLKQIPIYQAVSQP